ncbi:hypothetical protein QYM36_004681 [Artemia franciscana]|uniref:Uncharacterized protein n=1 Tax=Artemia franciscana TaxID=6661 RepID=A0AA88IFG3_ARTSF|nr:hypothetical protein QYM36_004681 [Artemia franciscana]
MINSGDADKPIQISWEKCDLGVIIDKKLKFHCQVLIAKSHVKGDFESLEKVQCRAVKLPFVKHHIPYEQQLEKLGEIRVMSLEGGYE